MWETLGHRKDKIGSRVVRVVGVRGKIMRRLVRVVKLWDTGEDKIGSRVVCMGRRDKIML